MSAREGGGDLATLGQQLGRAVLIAAAVLVLALFLLLPLLTVFVQALLQGLAPFFTALVLGFDVYAAAVLAIACLLVWRHAENIRKLVAGKESRIGQKKSPAVSPPPSTERDPTAGGR